jgi:hypothetical protein
MWQSQPLSSFLNRGYAHMSQIHAVSFNEWHSKSTIIWLPFDIFNIILILVGEFVNQYSEF